MKNLNINTIKEVEKHYTNTNESKSTEKEPNINITENQRVSYQSGKQLSDNTNNDKSRIINLISEILRNNEKPPTESVFKFENTNQA